jgi:hypothetical protein
MENGKRKEESGRLIELYSNRNILITEMKICFYKMRG